MSGMEKLKERFKPLRPVLKRQASEENADPANAYASYLKQRGAAGHSARKESSDDEHGQARPPSATLPKPFSIAKTAAGQSAGVRLREKVAAIYPSQHVSGSQDSGRTAVYTCTWRRPQQKKNKTWDGDGILILRANRLTLKDRDGGKDLGSSSLKSEIKSGDLLSVGGKDVEIDEEISEEEYKSGRCFSGDAVMEVAPAPTPALPPPSARVSLFKNPKPVQPRSKSTVESTQTKTPAARFDPKAEGAIVMPQLDKALQKRLNKKQQAIVDVVVDPQLARHLRPHQVEGVQFMYECVMGVRAEGNGCILADAMGLGKTLMSIALCWTLLRQNPFFGSGSVVNRVLIICPVTLIKKEFKKWLGEDRLRVFVADAKSDIKALCACKTFEVVIIGYERFRAVADDIKKAQPPVGLIIADEGHRLKGSETKILQALRTFNTTRRVILSGTPIQNDLSEFHTMADWVNPGLLDTYSAFKKIYETPILRSREAHCTPDALELGVARSNQLARVSQLFVLRRTADILDGYLPPKNDYVVFVRPSDMQSRFYQQILSTTKPDDLTSAMNGDYLSLLGDLSKLSNTPGLLVRRVAKKTIAYLEPIKEELQSIDDSNSIKLSGKLSLLANFLRVLKAQTHDKIVVVSLFPTMLDTIEELCKAASHTYCRLDGKTPQNKRMSIVEEFNRSAQEKQFIFLLSSKAGGVGLNLIGANRLILYDSDWNPSIDLQAMARIHRDGQKKECFIYRFLTTGAVDEKIYQRQIIKTGLAGSVMEISTDASSETDAFTPEELRAVFTFQADTSCNTHDLLGCDCNRETAEPSETESDDDAPITAFVSARNVKPSGRSKKSLARLNVLKNWTHLDCLRDGASADVEDPVLKACISRKAAANGEGVVTFLFHKPNAAKALEELNTPEGDSSGTAESDSDD